MIDEIRNTIRTNCPVCGGNDCFCDMGRLKQSVLAHADTISIMKDVIDELKNQRSVLITEIGIALDSLGSARLDDNDRAIDAIKKLDSILIKFRKFL